jgi:adenylate cyclase
VSQSTPPDRPGEPGQEFTRRVCAVLLADVAGFSALMGADDERTARAVRGLQTLVQGIAAEHNGHAEGFAGDAIFASFDSVVAAVATALSIQRALASETFQGLQLKTRIGVHYGDVLLREGAAFGDAINVAARLQTLARPGTICISEGVYRQVRNKFDEKFVDLGRQRLRNISTPIHAYMLVLREAERRSTPPRVVIAWAFGAAVGLAVVALALVGALRYWGTSGRPEIAPGTGTHAGAERAAQREPDAVEPTVARKVTLGVMIFRDLASEEQNDWRREALRDGLNAQLSQLSQVKVYSKEFIDFLITRKGLSDVEAAEQLGISKMLSGSYLVVGGTLRIETHIVDVASGVLEASYTTTGREGDFLKVQNDLAFGVISHLNLPVTDAEKRTLLARQTTNVDALKMLLEAEGGAAAAPPAPPQSGQPHSAVFRWLANTLPVGASLARAADDQNEILAVLEAYRHATESKDSELLAEVYTDFSPELQAAQQRYFENVRDLRVNIENVDVAVVGDEAVVSYTRTDDFLDARTGRPMHVAVRLTKSLRRVDGAWKMAAGK